jgi:5'(3')-deoxyribonucleotidase
MSVPTGRIIAFDMDSVLFDINQEVILPALEMDGYRHELEEIWDFDYARCLGLEQKRIAYREFARRDLYDGHSVSEEAMLTLEILRRNRNRVLAISSPFAGHASSKWSFLLRAGFQHKDIVLCGDKALVEYDVLIDDAPKYLRQVGNRRAIVFDQPWNRQLKGFVRAEGWWQVPAALSAFFRAGE